MIWVSLTADYRYDLTTDAFKPCDPKNTTNWQSIWVDTEKGVTLTN